MQVIKWLGELAIEYFISSPNCGDQEDFAILVGWLVSSVVLFALWAIIEHMRSATGHTVDRSTNLSTRSRTPSWVENASVDAKLLKEYAFVFDGVSGPSWPPELVRIQRFGTWAEALENLGYHPYDLSYEDRVYIDGQPLDIATKPRARQRIFIARRLSRWQTLCRFFR